MTVCYWFKAEKSSVVVRLFWRVVRLFWVVLDVFGLFGPLESAASAQDRELPLN